MPRVMPSWFIRAFFYYLRRHVGRELIRRVKHCKKKWKCANRFFFLRIPLAFFSVQIAFFSLYNENHSFFSIIFWSDGRACVGRLVLGHVGDAPKIEHDNFLCGRNFVDGCWLFWCIYKLYKLKKDISKLIYSGRFKILSKSIWKAIITPIINPGIKIKIQNILNLETNVFFIFSNSNSIFELGSIKLPPWIKSIK